MSQWLRARLVIEGLLVQTSSEALCCILEQTFYPLLTSGLT